MGNWRRASFMAALVTACLVGGNAPASAKDSSRIKGELQNTGIESEAEGSVKAGFKLSRSSLELKLKNLTANHDYNLQVGGEDKLTFHSDSSGGARLKFRAPTASASSFLLDFDPRGQVVSIDDSGSEVLRATVSGSDQPAGMTVDERVSLTRTSLLAAGESKVRYRTRKDGRVKFSAEVSGVPAGDYDLFVDGVQRGTITADALGMGEIELESPAEAGDLLLDFDPRGLTVDVAQAAGVLFTGKMAADAQGLTVCSFSETEVTLPSTGADADGSADARLRTKEDCDLDFSVEAEDVPAGDYEVRIGGVVKGTLTVVDDGFRTKGELEFDDEADDPGEVKLDFDPNGQTIEIVQGATVFFGGVFSGGTTTTTPQAGQCEASEMRLPMLDAGAIPGAKGDARFRVRDDCEQDLRIEIEDVPVGSYDLRVDGTVRGSFNVATTLEGENEGEFELDTNPDQPGELLLNFDPQGKLVEVLQGGVVVLSRTLEGEGSGSGSGSGGGGGGTCTAADDRVDFDAVGPVGGARGDVRYRSDVDCDRDLRVQIEDLPLGDYTLRIGGTSRGTISVVDVAGNNEGELEFDNEPTVGQLLLTFDPSGQTVEVVQGATVYLSLQLP